MFTLLILLVFLGILLSIPMVSLDRTKQKKEVQNREQTVERITPTEVYLLERMNRDTVVSGSMGMSSHSKSLRRTPTQNQTVTMEALADGQGVPTAIVEDALEDYTVNLSEFKQNYTKQNPQIFPFAKFTIHSKPGSAELHMESQYQ